MGKTWTSIRAERLEETDGHPGSLLQLALDNDIDLDHSCGGVCACSTCHVIVRSGLDSCNEATDDRRDMLDLLPDFIPSHGLPVNVFLMVPKVLLWKFQNETVTLSANRTEWLHSRKMRTRKSANHEWKWIGEEVAVRVGVKGGGCSGLFHTLDLIPVKPNLTWNMNPKEWKFWSIRKVTSTSKTPKLTGVTAWWTVAWNNP